MSEERSVHRYVSTEAREGNEAEREKDKQEVKLKRA